MIPDSLWRFGESLPFRDQNGPAKYPVDGSKLPESHVVIREYEPSEHFSRKLVVPEIRFSDWEPERASPR
jgi:hypothetical protein